VSTFHIPSAAGAGSLEFFERTPADTRRPVERFKVRLTDQELSAIGRVYASGSERSPAPLFARMAVNWNGWQGEVSWAALAGELSLRCTQDRAGHVTIRVELRSGPGENDWSVRSTIMTEAGQLDEIARQAELFFGAAKSVV
jgi:hypothetical protein